MEGRVKIFETYPKSEEILSFCPHIFVHLQIFVETFLFPDSDLTLPLIDFKLDRVEGQHTALF